MTAWCQRARFRVSAATDGNRCIAAAQADAAKDNSGSIAAANGAVQACGPCKDGRTPLHAGYPMQPQNSPPAFAPRLAVRLTIGLAQLGHVGTLEAVGAVRSGIGDAVAAAIGR